MLRTLSVILLIMGSMGMLFCFRESPEVIQSRKQSKGEGENKQLLNISKPTNTKTSGYKMLSTHSISVIQSGLKEPIFISCFIFTIISSMTGGFISNMFTSIGYGIFNYDSQSINMIAILGPVCNAGSRIIVGLLVENKYYPMEFKAMVNVFYAILIVGLLLITFVHSSLM